MAPAANPPLTGMSWIGNASLWRRQKIVGVFADCHSDGWMDFFRGQWAIEMGCKGKILVGIFSSWTEREILRLHLRNGGRAVWILGMAFPGSFNRDCSCAIWEGRLLVVSCFWIPRWTYSTYRYCCQLVSACADSLVFWGIDSTCYTKEVYDRACARGVKVELFAAPFQKVLSLKT